MYRILLPLLSLLLLVSCEPDKTTPIPVNPKRLHIMNGPISAANVRLYVSLDDFLNDINPLHSLSMQISEEVFYPVDGLPENGNVYLYFYNDDYSASTFGISGILACPINLANDTNLITVQCDTGRNQARYYLDSNKKETNWSAVDKWIGPFHVWDTLSDNGKYHRITINKASDFIYTYKDYTGNTQTFKSKVDLANTLIDKKLDQMEIYNGQSFFARINRSTYADPAKRMVRDSFMMIQIDESLVGTFTLFVRD